MDGDDVERILIDGADYMLKLATDVDRSVLYYVILVVVPGSECLDVLFRSVCSHSASGDTISVCCADVTVDLLE